MKCSTTFSGIIGGVIGAIISVAAVATLTFVLAAPTEPPPAGNPPYPAQGPAGADGTDGVDGAFGTCKMKESSCSFNFESGCSTTVSLDAGWWMTGGNCAFGDYLRSGGSTSTSVNCSCWDVASVGGGNCRALLWECQ